MYRFELDPHRSILVLTLHGMQDAWEAKLMRMEWPQHQANIGNDWSLIIDVKDFHGAPPAARKEEQKFAELLAAQPFKSIFVVHDGEKNPADALLQGLTYQERAEFHVAYREAGGEDRTIHIQEPVVGHYPANNAPPLQR
ncbi:hypothetical protein GF324_08855 [bacterium]|nr:hypothetical protein [bacterium]